MLIVVTEITLMNVVLAKSRLVVCITGVHSGPCMT